ncbi:steroid receptor RNA activator 1-like [Anneissia japonica]|uniref:steroid receptor RNA activator 1-like n=1 Tax=Anneissia japonica TaxID=1529436 RepID=UPI001425A8BE|nr:steroid receptor RNA activator 1-like [Anneissia japonica]
MDGSTKPGNPDRGWNDPPMFNFSAKAEPSPRSNVLNKRVAPPQQPPRSGSNNSSPLNARMASAKYTSTDVSAPPMTTPPMGGPPAGHSSTSTTTGLSSDSIAGKDDDTSLDVVERIKSVLNECENKLQKRIFDDISKRLVILSDRWSNGNLSNPVKIRMSKLSNALVDYQYDEAFKIHLALMVDHVTEVSQWMVGIKRLIHEAKTIRPKLAEDPRVEAKESLIEDGTHSVQLFDTKTLKSPQHVKKAEEITQEKLESDDTSNSKTLDTTTEQVNS